MNPRIRELAEQAEKLADEETKAFTDDTGHWRVIWNEVYDKKFAELIVKECCQAVWSEECNTSDLALEEYNRTARKIRQYFGVEL